MSLAVEKMNWDVRPNENWAIRIQWVAVRLVG